MREAAKALREQAQAVGNERLEAAAAELDRTQAAKASAKAAAALQENRLAEAQEAQQQALDRLEGAARTAAGASRVPHVVPGTMPVVTPQAGPRPAWQVALDAPEREILSQARAERFPARYEQALVQYYRILAGGGGP